MSKSMSRVVNKKNNIQWFSLPHLDLYISLSLSLLKTNQLYTTQKIFKHWCRGQAGFDNSGRGYYFANNGPHPYPHGDRRPYPEPYFGPQRPIPPPPHHFNHYNNNNVPQNPPQYDKNQNQSQTTTTTTPRVPPEFYQGKPAQSALIHTVSSNTIGTVDNDSTANSNKNHNREINDKEKIR
jgi:hypothetical protein